MNTKITGDFGERCAVAHLKKNGYKIVECNFKTKISEIDIIAYDGDCLCFIEVKTRSSTEYGLACEAVDYRKQKKIISGASLYMSLHNVSSAVRFDVVEVYIRKGILSTPYKINVIKNAFDASRR